jgi:hypothetical protein
MLTVATPEVSLVRVWEFGLGYRGFRASGKAAFEFTPADDRIVPAHT